MLKNGLCSYRDKMRGAWAIKTGKSKNIKSWIKLCKKPREHIGTIFLNSHLMMWKCCLWQVQELHKVTEQIRLSYLRCGLPKPHPMAFGNHTVTKSIYPQSGTPSKSLTSQEKKNPGCQDFISYHCWMFLAKIWTHLSNPELLPQPKPYSTSHKMNLLLWSLCRKELRKSES